MFLCLRTTPNRNYAHSHLVNTPTLHRRGLKGVFCSVYTNKNNDHTPSFGTLTHEGSMCKKNNFYRLLQFY